MRSTHSVCSLHPSDKAHAVTRRASSTTSTDTEPMQYRHFHTSLLLSLPWFLLCIATGCVDEAQDSKICLNPHELVLEGHLPGDHVEAKLMLSNSLDEPVTATAISSCSCLELEPRKTRLLPGESKPVKFTLRAPSNYGSN